MKLTSQRKKSRTSSVVALFSLVAYVVLTSLSAWAALFVKAESSVSGRTRFKTGSTIRTETARSSRPRYFSVARQVAKDGRSKFKGFEKTEAGKQEVGEESVGCGERIELRSSAFRFASSQARRELSPRRPRIESRTGRHPVLAPHRPLLAPTLRPPFRVLQTSHFWNEPAAGRSAPRQDERMSANALRASGA
jgi:hypothetical protein